MKIQKKIPLLIISMAVIPLLIITVIIFFSTSQTSLNTYKKYLNSLSLSISNQLNDYHIYQTNSIIHSKKIDTYNQLLTNYKLNNKIDNNLYNEAKTLLTLTSNSNIYFYKSILVDLNGDVVCSSLKSDEGKNISGEDYFKFDKDYFWSYKKLDTSDFEAIVSAPIVDASNNPIGLIINFSNLEYINSSIQNFKVGNTGYLYLIDNKGNGLSHYSSNSNKENNKQLKKIVNTINNNIENKASNFIKYKKEKSTMFASYNMVEKNDWIVISAIQEKEIYESAIIVCIVILLIILLVYVIALNLSSKVVKKIVNPLLDLSNNIKKISDGDLTQRLTYNQDDEFKELYDNINIMAENIKLSTQGLEECAFIDTLTKIFNRHAIYKVMEEQFKKGKNQVAIMMDLNGFKNINDTYGHDIGDVVLKKTAEILSHYERKNIYFSRLGGDEFFCFITNYKNQDDIIKMVKDIGDDVKKMQIKDIENINVSVSTGIAFSNNEEYYSDLMKKSDMAMYKAKKSNRVNKLVIFK